MCRGDVENESKLHGKECVDHNKRHSCLHMNERLHWGNSRKMLGYNGVLIDLFCLRENTSREYH